MFTHKHPLARPASPIARACCFSLVLVATACAVAAFAYAGNAQTASPAERLHGKVIAITDGDTVRVLVGSETVKVRLWGIDAPEHNQAFGTRSQQALSAAAFGQDVIVEAVGQDRYGRTLGVIYVGKVNVNLEQVRLGLAWWYQKYAPRALEYQQAESAARQARRGLWVDNEPQPPWEFRSDRRGGRH